MAQLQAERYEAVGDLFRVLASPVRIALVDLLAEAPLFVHQIVATSGLSQPHVSQQLRILRDAGLVRRVRQGREVVYALRDEHVAHIVADAIAHAVEARTAEPVDPYTLPGNTDESRPARSHPKGAHRRGA